MRAYDANWDRRVALRVEPFDPFAPHPEIGPPIVCEPHEGSYTRGYLPHVDLPLTQFITFRLHDSFPATLLDRWKAEFNSMEESDRRRELYRRTEAYVDAGHGTCWLRQPEIAQIVEDQLRFHDGVRYDLLAWTLMPNHVHLLIHLYEGFSLPKVVQSWKARSARTANEWLGRQGPFWSRDYYDRWVRDEAHYANCLRYVDVNPVRAGLCASPEEWAWGSARRRTLSPSATRRSLEVFR